MVRSEERSARVSSSSKRTKTDDDKRRSLRRKSRSRSRSSSSRRDSSRISKGRSRSLGRRRRSPSRSGDRRDTSNGPKYSRKHREAPSPARRSRSRSSSASGNRHRRLTVREDNWRGGVRDRTHTRSSQGFEGPARAQQRRSRSSSSSSSSSSRGGDSNRRGRRRAHRRSSSSSSSDSSNERSNGTSARERERERGSGGRTASSAVSHKRVRSPSSSSSRNSNKHGKKRGRDWKTRSERRGTPSPQASKPYPPARERAESPPAAARLRWSPSPSPTAPTASESIRRSQSYRAKRDNPVQQAGSSASSLSRTNGGKVSGGRGAVEKGDLASQDKSERHRRGGRSPSPPSSSSSDGRRRRRRRSSREEPLGRVSTGRVSDAPTSQSAKAGSAVGNSISRSGDAEAPSPSKSSPIGKNGASKKKHKKDKDKKNKKEKKSKKSKKSKDADKGRPSGRDDEGSPSPRRSEHGRRKNPAVATADSGAPEPSERRTRSDDDFTSPPAAAKSSKPPKSSKPLSAVPSAAAAASSSTPSTSSAGKEKKASTGKKSKRQAVPASLLSFEDEGEDGGGAEFQGLGAATLNEFKRSHKKSQTESVAATAAAAAAAATAAASAGDSTEEAPSVTARLGLLLEKKRDAVLGPSKISTAESRGEREYQEDRHTVVQCLHAPDDAHTKFDACPPCFFAVFDGHNGHLAADIARSKLHTYVAKAAPTTGLRGEPTERLEGLLRAGFASTEAEILKETEETKDDDEDDGTGDGDGNGNGSGNGNSRQDGTTVTACLLVGNFLVTANVGDSRAVLGSVGHEGKLRCKNISVDHKPEDPHEKRRIKAAGGEVVFNGCYRVQHENVSCRLAVSRSLGDRQFKGQGGQPPGSQVPPPPDMRGQLVSPEPSVKSVKLEPHDRVVIVASDGLWDVMAGLEAVEIAIAAHGKAPTTTGRAPSWANALVNGVGGGNAEADPANALVREAVKRGTSDNVTAVVTILSWD